MGYSLSPVELGVVMGLLLLVFIGVVLLQRVIDTKCTLAMTQSNVSNQLVFDSLYEASPVAYITIDTVGTILDFNPAFVHLLRTEHEVIVRQNFYSLINQTPELDVGVFKEKIAAGLTIHDLEVSLRSLTETEVWVLMSVYTTYKQHERLIVMVDMTEKKRVDTAKSEFVALATHQLRTPIAAIRWNVELLEKNMGDGTSEKQAQYLAKINRNVHRMIALINDFLSVSKLEMGTFAASEETVDLTQFMDGIIEEFDGKVTEKQLAITRNDTPPHLTIRTDSRLFHIIVSNLISNAVKYVQPAGEIELSYTRSGDQLEIVVADNGMGIPVGEIDQLFTKFFRASNAQAHYTQGTGLGLYIVQQSVEQLGGTITVWSEEGQGTRFTIRVPARVVSE